MLALGFVLFFFFYFLSPPLPPGPRGHRQVSGSLLAAMRKEAGLSLSELTRRLREGGYPASRAGLHKYERGDRPVSLEVFDAVIIACGFELDHVHLLRLPGLRPLASAPAELPAGSDPRDLTDEERAGLVRWFRRALRGEESSDVPSQAEAEPLLLPSPGPEPPAEQQPNQGLSAWEDDVLHGLRDLPTVPLPRAVRLHPPLDPVDTIRRLIRNAPGSLPADIITGSRAAAEAWVRGLELGTDRERSARVFTSREFARDRADDEPRLLLIDGLDAFQFLSKGFGEHGTPPGCAVVAVGSCLDGVSDKTMLGRRVKVEQVNSLRDGYRSRAFASFDTILLPFHDPSGPGGSGRRTEAPPEGAVSRLVDGFDLVHAAGRIAVLAGSDGAAREVDDLFRSYDRPTESLGRRALPTAARKYITRFASTDDGVLCFGRRVRREDEIPPISTLCILAPIRLARLEEYVLPFLAATPADATVQVYEVVMGDVARRERAWRRLVQAGTCELGLPGRFRVDDRFLPPLGPELEEPR